MEFGARTQRRMLRRAITASVITVVGTVSLVACAPPSPKPTPTATTIFASEEEALAAATDTYQEYLAVSDAVSADGGQNPERIQPLVTDAFWASEMAGIQGLVEGGYRTSGSSSFDQTTLVDTDRVSTTTIQTCLDVSQVRVLDSGGADVTPTDRRSRTRLEVEFAVTAEPSPSLLVARSDVWSGPDPC